MSESLTGADAAQVTGLPTQPTEDAAQQTPAESVNQDTISREQSQEAVSDDTANQAPTDTEGQKQTQQTGGESHTDDGLAKFAESQGFDLENATDDVKRALKIAHDNQKAFRSKPTGPKVTEATESLGDGSIEAEVAQLKYQRTTDEFFSQEGIDRSLEAKMVEILNEKKEHMQRELTASLGAEKAQEAAKNYAFQLSRDLDTLYGMATLRSGQSANTTAPVDVEQIRREERESINKAMSASAPQAHATNQSPAAPEKVDLNWIQNSYDSRNPEHVKLVDEFFSK